MWSERSIRDDLRGRGDEGFEQHAVAGDSLDWEEEIRLEGDLRVRGRSATQLRERFRISIEDKGKVVETNAIRREGGGMH